MCYRGISAVEYPSFNCANENVIIINLCICIKFVHYYSMSDLNYQ